MPFISNVPMAAVTVNNHIPYISSLAKAIKDDILESLASVDWH
jgi:hypothetical protein